METQAQKNLEWEVRQAIEDGIKCVVVDMVGRGDVTTASVLAKHRTEIVGEVFFKLRRHHRIGRARRKQTELNP